MKLLRFSVLIYPLVDTYLLSTKIIYRSYAVTRLQHFCHFLYQAFLYVTYVEWGGYRYRHLGMHTL